MKKPPSPHLWERVGVRGGMVSEGVKHIQG